MRVITDEKKVDDILTRGVEDVIMVESLKKKLLSGKQLRIKLGIDPTGPKIHLGRATVLRKLKQFQDLGHKVVLIVGDFTARIGDASDKIEKRPMLSQAEIKRNMRNYKKQIGKILDLRKTEFKYNSKWLKKLGFIEISELAESFSVPQMSARRNFKERLDRNDEVSVREFLYPLMQGYDSVAIKADVEIGGFDQLFNLKAGRKIQKHYNMPEQDILTTKMIYGTDGRKMSTSWGNVITIVDDPADMFGKVMSMHDEHIEDYFLMCTDLPKDEFEKELANPMEAKKKLGWEIVKLYHGENEANEAKEGWVNTFSKKEIPENVVEVENKETVVDVLISTSFIKSKTEARRLLEGGAVTDLDEDKKIGLKDSFKSNHTYKIGKHQFIKIK